MVRVPLGGRRVRGWVTGLRDGDPAGLKPLAGVSGNLAVFDPKLLETLRWTAVHYVAPLAVVLGKPTPPNVPRRRAAPAHPEPPVGSLPGRLAAWAVAAAGGRHPRAVVALGQAPWAPVVTELASRVAAGSRSALVVCPTLAEAQATAAAVGAELGERVVLGSSALPAADTTAAWVQAALAPGTVVVGTREVAFWPVAALGMAVVLGDGRRGLKDRQTPTTEARPVLRRRAGVERFGLAMLGAVPTLAALAAGPEVIQVGARPWPLVEVVDRGAEPPGSGFVTAPVLRAVRAVVERGGRVFVFTRARGYAPAFRCARCRAIRRCPECGARPGREPDCARCGSRIGPCRDCGGAQFEPLGAGVGRMVEELRRLVAPDAVGAAGEGRPVTVGTERDLVGLAPVELAVVVDADGLILAPHYRAGEDALRLLARVAQAVGGGRGRRCMVQSGLPGHEVIVALRRGDPLEYLTAELAARSAGGLPPTGDLLVVETEGEPPDAAQRLKNIVAGRGEVHGPAEVRGRHRWLIQGPELRPARVALRGLVQEWRDGGTRVRVDADPLDL